MNLDLFEDEPAHGCLSYWQWAGLWMLGEREALGALDQKESSGG